MKKLFALVMALTLINFGSTAYAAVDRDGAENQRQAMVVKNSHGEYVGTVTNALVDSSGNIAFVILSIGEEMEEQGKEIAVPLDTFSFDRENEILVLNVSKEELAAAPEFAISDLSDPTFAEKVYRFFGLVPSWAEETAEGER